MTISSIFIWRAFVDGEDDLHVAVGELLDVGVILDLEVALALVVVLHPLARTSGRPPGL